MAQTLTVKIKIKTVISEYEFEWHHVRDLREAHDFTFDRLYALPNNEQANIKVYMEVKRE
jgi:hypothetical protein